MACKIKKIWCANKNCGRGPSYMGLEPMYAIPIDHKYHFFCGECFKVILHKFGVTIPKDLMNLLTHVSGYDAYHTWITAYIKKRKY